MNWQQTVAIVAFFFSLASVVITVLIIEHKKKVKDVDNEISKKQLITTLGQIFCIIANDMDKSSDSEKKEDKVEEVKKEGEVK